ncbi:STAS domain-containing protein [Actinoplanes utahensis]|uniref:STAS domain-containing protein n=1 Tax=Actinoplanes utahensis TaxID=1869 RepID=UPI000B2D983E|nr:STAS domain-containing protein [Actinoplanes utahensis]
MKEHMMDVSAPRITVTATTTELVPGVVRVRAVGDLDAATVPVFRSRLSALLTDEGGGERVELDLSGIDFCDVAGLRALQAVGDAAQAQRPARITAAGPWLDVLLRLCPIPRLLDYAPPPATIE